MRVLVTGHAGYIGSVMVEKLLQRGYAVRGLDTCYYTDCALWESQGPTEAVTKDVRDVEPDDLDGIDAVIHLAALSNDPTGELDPKLTLEINCHATVRLATLAKAKGVRRFLFASSCSMYGSSGTGAVTEEAPLNPLTAYAVSKVRAEQALSRLADGAFSPVLLRNATAYGLSPKLRFDLVLNNLVGWAVTTGEVMIMSDGTPWRPLIHVEDIADAFIAALEAPLDAIHNEAFNVGQDTENYQVRDIAETVRAVVPGCRVAYASSSGPDARSYRVDFSKLRNRIPCFRPRWNIEKGARQLHEALLEFGVTLEDFRGRRFTRLSQLQHLIREDHLAPNLRWRHSCPLKEVS